MTKALACHVFAHKDGRYQTVSSVGADPREIKALEQFFFGQTNDAGYLKSLRTEPGVIWRRIDGRIALTRVTQGSADSNGRPTLNFATLLDADRGTLLARSVADVVLGDWKATSAGASITPSPVGETLPINPAGISHVALAVRDGKRVVHPAKSFSLRDVAAVIESCAEEPDFSLCYKSLNDRAPVTVNLVSSNTSERTMSATKPTRTNPLPGASRSMRGQQPASGANTLVLLAVCAVLVVQTIFVWSATRPSTGSGELGEMQKNINTRIDQRYEQHARNTKESRKFLSDEIAALKESVTENASALAEAKQRDDEVVRQIETLSQALEDQVHEVNEVYIAVGRIGADVRDTILPGMKAISISQPKFEKETKATLAEIKVRLGNLKELKNALDEIKDLLEE